MSTTRGTRWCDFCGRTRESVECMVNGALADICNECVASAAHLIAEHRKGEDWRAWKAEVPQIMLTMGGRP